MRAFIRSSAVAVLLVAGLAYARPAEAATILLTTRVALSGTDFIDWAQLGPDFTAVANGTGVVTNGGASLTVSESLADGMERRGQDSSWGGNFAPGDALLWNASFGSTSANDLILDFVDPIRGGGAQIQANYHGAFVARITALDSGGNSLGSFTVNGTSNGNGDNSAIFIGILSDAVDIDRLVFSLDSALDDTIGDFAINRVDLVDTSAAVPEPGTLLLLGGGLAALAVRLRRRR